MIEHYLLRGMTTDCSVFINPHCNIQIRGKRVVAHWNIGNGKKMVTNSHPINFIPLADRGTWYHIDLVRTGNAVNLTVALKESTIGEGE